LTTTNALTRRRQAIRSAYGDNPTLARNYLRDCALCHTSVALRFGARPFETLHLGMRCGVALRTYVSPTQFAN